MILEFPDPPEPELLCFLQAGIEVEAKVSKPLFLRSAWYLQAPSSTDIGNIKSVEPIKIQIDHLKPLPKLPQYPLKPGVNLGLSLTVEDLIKQGLIIPCTTSYTTLILPIKNQMGKAGDLSNWMQLGSGCN